MCVLSGARLSYPSVDDQLEDYAVLVDGKPCVSTAQREKILRQENDNSPAVDFGMARSFSTESWQEQL